MIGEADLASVERWFAATLDHCASLRSCQRHEAARNSAHGALKLARALKETESVHGFFADFLVRPYEARFGEYL